MISRGLYLANESFAFVLEIAALAALGWRGFAHDGFIRVVLGLGTPLLAAVIWGLFAAPKATVRLPLPAVLAVKAVVFGAAALALYAVGHPVLAAVFAVVVVLNTTAATVTRHRFATPLAASNPADCRSSHPHR
jgi:hypothetical protein